MSRFRLPIAAVLLAATPAIAQDKHADARKALDVFRTHCHRCHGQDGAVEGALNYVTDLGKLVARKKVTPGDALGSRLYRRMDDGTMPPPGENPRPSDADLAAVRRWIDAGAPAAETTAARAAITTADVYGFILADLDAMDRRARRFQRYFTLTHLYNAGLGADELQTYRNALAKLVNSLSWHPTISLPVAVDPNKTVLRIDLRWFMWDATVWNRVVTEYPYGILDDSTAARAVSVGTAARLPAIRADWFVATASRAPLYYDVLQLPQNLPELERQLRVDAAVNIQQERVKRAGFNGSGVSRFNRILERHDSAHGFYWRSYDFDEPPANLAERANGTLLPDRRNIFAFPLGPGLFENPFQHAGGEAIFSLPNGLHAFFIMNANNLRLDKAPVAIVSDPKRPDRAVEAGVSCMSCHMTGILPKADQIRDHLAKNPNAFSRNDAEIVRALYPAKDATLAAMAEDAKAYTAAVAKTGAKVSRFEAVSTITLKYEADIDLGSAAAEVGLTAEQFRDRINNSEVLTKHVGALRAAGGTLTRQIWLQAFGDVARELKLGTLFQANLNGPTLPDNTGELDPLEARDGAANGMAFTADGRRALVASGDRSVRYYDVGGRRDVRRLVGHTASVWAVAWSPDGRRAVSGGMDATARVWDVDSAQERARYAGHSSLVAAVGFTPDGRWGVSGGFDGVLAVWKAATGEEVWRAEKLGFVTALAVDPRGRYVAAGTGKAVRVFGLNDGREIAHLPSDHGPVSALAASADGERLAFGTDSGAAVVWGWAADGPRPTVTGHGGPVRGVALSGRWLLTGGDRTVRLWDVTTGKEVAAFRKHGGPVVAVGFVSNGTQTLSGDRDVNLLPWAVGRFLVPVPVAPPPRSLAAPDTIPPAKP